MHKSMWTSERFAAGRPRAVRPPHLACSAAALLAAVVWWLAPRIAAAEGWRYRVIEIKRNVFAWLPEDIIEADGDPQYERAGNAGFVITSEGVVVVDATNSPFHAREVLYEIRQRTNVPVRTLIDTGAAGDEMLGNQVFADLQAAIISTPAIQAETLNRRQALTHGQAGDEKLQRRLRGIHITPPNQTFDGTMQLSPGGQTIRLVAFAGLEAAAVYLPSAKVVFLGDLFENQYFPRLESRDIHRWIEALHEVETWDADVYVPGHGDPGGKREVEQFRLFLEWLSNEIQTRITQGKSLDQIKADLLPFKNYPWHARELQEDLVAGVYQQLSPSAGRPGNLDH